ncbi:ATP-binding protein [Porphyromonas somerae]|uniref:AAA family ATPase n=1 Tax=Porphyromonas somerae TaxID=322095 RepID=UPI002A816CD1|nr:ATP-binding protein [Porphyromonas somerae]MDY3884353.1 ATP-binding protein [Porphyromonas somerae]
MARADLLLSLVKHALSGNKLMVRKVTEAIIAEERSKNHLVLADKLEIELTHNAPDFTTPNNNGVNRIQSDFRAENLITEIHPQRRMDSLILPKEVIHFCEEYIQEQYRVDILRSYGLEPRNRILLIGAPGNGKTSLAEAIAESLMIPLYVVKYESIIGSYLGETASRLRKLIDFVSTRKCVLFFDEFETLGKERGDTHETGEIKRVVSSLLLQIDDLPSHVTIIGATNHPELLDRAVWRRFQIRMYLPMPTRANISLWVEKFQQKHNIIFGFASETIAKKLFGSNYSEIEEFGLSVLRKHILSLPDSNTKAIVAEELKNWNSRTMKPEVNNLNV